MRGRDLAAVAAYSSILFKILAHGLPPSPPLLAQFAQPRPSVASQLGNLYWKSKAERKYMKFVEIID